MFFKRIALKSATALLTASALAACSASTIPPTSTTTVAAAPTTANGVVISHTLNGIRATDSSGKSVFSFSYNATSATFAFSSQASTETIPAREFSRLKPGDTLAVGKFGSMYIVDDQTIRDSNGNTYRIFPQANRALVQEFDASGKLKDQGYFALGQPIANGQYATAVSGGCAWALFDLGIAVAGTLAASGTGIGVVIGLVAVGSTETHAIIECAK